MKVYAIPGLGADSRVFKNLNLSVPLEVIEWKVPAPQESMADYAQRMADEVDDNEPFVLLGLSFGGVMAQEILQYVKPEKLILLSSIAHQDELQALFKLIYKSGILEAWPSQFFKPPVALCKWYFGTDDTDLIKAILSHSNNELIKWSTIRLMEWEKRPTEVPTVRIHGTNDRLLLYHPSAIPIEGGTHFMVLDRAEEVSKIINTRVIAPPLNQAGI